MEKALLSIGLASNSANYDHIMMSCFRSFLLQRPFSALNNSVCHLERLKSKIKVSGVCPEAKIVENSSLGICKGRNSLHVIGNLTEKWVGFRTDIVEKTITPLHTKWYTRPHIAASK